MTAEEDVRSRPGLKPRSAVLMVTTADAIEPSAAQLAAQLNLTIEIASTRSSALRLLDRRVYSIVIVDQFLAESDPELADLIWKHSAHAIPLQIGFGIASTSRMAREIRSALDLRQREQMMAAAAASAGLNTEIRNAVTGFLLESHLALMEPELTCSVRSRLETLAGIAGRLQELLGSSSSEHATLGGLRAPVE